MDRFVEKYQPELYDLWKMGIQVSSATSSELKIINRNDLVRKRKRSTSTSCGPVGVAKQTAGKRAMSTTATKTSKPVLDETVERLVRSVRDNYAQLEFSSFADSTQRRHQIDVRNIALADRLDCARLADLDSAHKMLHSLAQSTPHSLCRLSLAAYASNSFFSHVLDQ